MRTLSVEVSDTEFAQLGVKKDRLSLKELRKILMKLPDSTKNNRAKTPLVDSLMGAVKMPENFDYKESLTEALTEKYLK